ncbi:ATP-dependent RNA helicase CsdA [Geoalkalibacter ferrihydriticus]|uniref:ATP-dependent RNA helicase DeaD n=2 Tax=Geoalkalibacter ferrihydriticus TaxID=392333 RepID=A0A0C2HM53_9BACT|nr:DEAD/DEAH box helicase [Geoalkalibacter ferrihydriticus]KIH76060.1 RNA helicase [Geoalkalibacter ferrihydriticus DSM 17813]SDM47584.1 ATP-dependent RNA helicase CsdA [Geoalkalibacter ferrihydriticus]
MTEETLPTFAELELAPAIARVIDEIGYESPSPIQARSIPPLLAGRDLLGQAQTGTGKTAAFALPLLSRIDPALKSPQILVLTPTRELALQVAEAMQTYARHLKDFHVLPVYGGQNMGQQLRMLARGVQAVVGTPGRIQDHLRRGTLRLDRLIGVVVDEADEMLKMGFIDEVEQILEHTPAHKQVALFSATMPKEVMQVARRQLKDPVEIRIKAKTATVDTIAQRFWQVKGLHKLDALTRILEAEEIEGMIVFVRTKTATVELAEKLEARGFSSAPLNGDMTQALREKTVERLKSGSLDIVVATDVAARGLDVKRISHVINYDIPYDTEAYIHRIGRTGRAGREGKAILFVAPREMRLLSAIEQATRQPITSMSLPTRKDITDRRIGLFKEQIATAMESEDLEFFEEFIDSYQSEYDVGLRRIAATLAYLVQKDRPLQPEGGLAEEVVAPEQPSRSRPARPREAQDADKQRYRIEVGRAHKVEPGNIVGAITNEANLSSRDIGQIKIFDSFSLVDLPRDLPADILRHLQGVWVCGQRLQLSEDRGAGQALQGKPPKRRPYGKGGDQRPFKPGPKKPPYSRRGPKTDK